MKTLKILEKMIGFMNKFIRRNYFMVRGENSATQYPGSILLFTLFLSCFDLPNVDLMNGLESFPREYTSEQSHCGTPDIDSFIVSVLWCYPLVLFPSLSKLLLLCRIWTQYLCTSYWRFGLTLPKCSLISSGNSK